MQISKTLLDNEGAKVLFDTLGHDDLRFVGGCVRDDILEVSDYDIDLATKHKPSEAWKILEKAGIKTIATGIKHGTITALIDSTPYEITTLRSDKNCDGRHAEVDYIKDWEQDSQRRDFTINALYADSSGEVYDYHNGLEDLKDQHIKFIGNAQDRIEEDSLRIFRYFRFCSIYGDGNFDDSVLDVIKSKAKTIENLSGERIANEMFKLFTGKFCLQAVKQMNAANIWQGEFDFEALERLSSLPTDKTTKLFSLLSKEDAEDYFARWKVSNTTKSLYKLLNSKYEDYQYLKFLNEIGKEKFFDLINYKFAKEEIEEEKLNELNQLMQDWEQVKFPISGEDLIALGFKKGEGLGRTLNALKKEWYKNSCKLDRDFLITKAKENLGE